MMMWALLLLPVLAAASPDHANPNQHSSAPHPACQPASVQLSTIAPTADLTNSDDTLQLEFTVLNPNSVSVTILKRETPLEGIRTNMFQVRSPEDKLMEYRGMDARRVPQPSASEYVILAAGASITRVINLGDQYSFESDGEYSISLSKHVTGSCGSGKLPMDYSSAATKVTVRGATAHELRWSEHIQRKQQEIAENFDSTRRTIKNDASYPCNAAQLAEITKWDSDADQKIDAAIACTESSCPELVDTWFGKTATQTQFSAVTAVFTKMKQLKGNAHYACPADYVAPPLRRLEGDGQGCDGSTYAYVQPADPAQTIYICLYTLNYPDYSEKVQTVIHELSHFFTIGSATDDAYGQATCYNLAQSDPAKAQKTADNYGYFGINTNVCYPNAPAGYKPTTPPCHNCLPDCATPPCETVGAPTPMVCATTPAPTPATATATTTPAYSVEYKVNLAGSITAATFDSTQQGIVKSTVASNAGKVCGSDATASCSSTDVTISSISRRSVDVNLALGVATSAAATASKATLDAFMGSSGTFAAKLTAAGVTGITGTSVVSSNIKSNDSSSTDHTIMLICIAAGALLLIGLVVAFIWWKCFCKHTPEMDHVDLKETVAVDMNADASEPAPKETGNDDASEPAPKEADDAHADAV